MIGRLPAALLLAAACSACSASPPAASAPSALLILTRRPVRGLDPDTTGDLQTLSVLRGNVFESLVKFDRERGAVPELAVSWGAPSDTSWRFELRRGVRFHDGRALGAADVVAALERVRTHRDSQFRGHVADIESIKLLDAHSIEIRTRRPSPLLLNVLCEVPILAPGAAPGPQAVAGTGPYRVRSLDAQLGLELERFPGYWGEPPRWERATFRAQPDDERRVAAMLAGDADLIEVAEPTLLPRLRAPGVNLMSRDVASISILGFLVRPRPGNAFADREVRRAVSLAIDRPRLVEEVLDGYGRVPTQLAPPGVFGFDPELPPLEPDLARARQALEASGAPLAGVEVPLAFAADNTRLAEFVAEQVARIGVRFRLAPSDWPSLDRRLQAQEVPAYIFAMTYPTLETGTLLAEGFATRSEHYGSLNFSGFSDPELDALIAAADTEIEPGRRLALLQGGMRRAMSEHVWLPLAVRKDVFAARAGLSWRPALTGRIELQAIVAR